MGHGALDHRAQVVGQAGYKVAEMITCCKDCPKRNPPCWDTYLTYLLEDAIWEMDKEEEAQQRELEQFHRVAALRRRKLRQSY